MLPLPNSTVVFQRLDEGAVLFSPESELYFGLNDVGAKVWQLLPPVLTSLDALCAAVSREYPDVDAAVIRQDVEELLEQLLREGLVVAASDSGDANLAG